MRCISWLLGINLVKFFVLQTIFAKEFEVEMSKTLSPTSKDAPIRKRMMSDSEVITILICFHFNSYWNFKHYYLGCVCQH